MINEYPNGIAHLLGSQKIMHLSIDDTISLFSDLTANSGLYASIFDQATLAFFKHLHDVYGAVISCYVFNTDGKFTLSDTPGIFRKEFMKNKDWLKFGFHSLNHENYAATTADKAKRDYDTVISQLIRITGSCECIDRIVRLHNFAGNRESLLAMKNTSCGILGLLCADDTRKSYFLDEATSLFIYNRNRYDDPSSQLMFFPTNLRMESVADLDARLSELGKTPWENESRDLILFTHESQLNSATKSKLEKCCQFAIENGYAFAFPMTARI